MSTASGPIDSATSLRTQTEVAARELQRRLWSTRRALLGHRVATGVCLMFAVVALCLMTSAVLDWSMELATPWRAAWMLAVFATAAAAGLIGWRHWIASYSLSDTAVDAEKQLLQFGQRLRTTLDYEQLQPAPATAAPELLRSLHRETRALAQQTEWRDAIDARPLWKSGAVAALIVIGWMAAVVVVPEFRIATARAMLLPLEYTAVTYTPDSATIRPGESVAFTVVVTGRPVATAVLRHRIVGTEDWSTVELLPASDATDVERQENQNSGGATISEKETDGLPLVGDLMASLIGVQQDTEFEVIAGPRPLPKGLIRVLQPLTLQKSEAHVTPPEYTRQQPFTADQVDLKVLEGSSVAIVLTVNRPAAEAQLSQLDTTAKLESDSTIPVPLLQENEIHLRLSDLRQSVSWTLSARTADGMTLEPLPIRIRVQPDKKPELQFVEPSEELVVTPTADVPFVVEARDDLGLYKVGVMFQIGSGPMQTLADEDFNGSQEPERVAKTFYLEDFGLTQQDAVTYYAFAEDNYFGQTRRTTTPLRFIDIRPYKISFEVVESNCPPCNGSSVTLEELITRQRQGLTQAFQATDRGSSKETCSHLSEQQEELLDATAQFAAGLAERGADVPSLTSAISHMEKAIEGLDAVDTASAVSAEQSALAELIRARENLRKLLKQSNSPSASACRKFDRQQRQKLRMPEKKKGEQQQVAEARKKLEDLAKREKSWSQQAQKCHSSGSSSSGSPSQAQPKPSNSETSDSSPSGSKPSATQPQQTSETETANQDAPQKSSPADAGRNDNPTPEELAAEQEKLQAELAALQQQLQNLKSAGQAAQDQAQQAAESMQQGLAELKDKQGEFAAKAGERAARQLEELSEHLAAMTARDFGQRLDQAQKLAQQLASRQGDIEKQIGQKPESQSGQQAGQDGDPQSRSADEPNENPSRSNNPSNRPGRPAEGATTGEPASAEGQGVARDQRAIAARTRMLAELLDALEKDAQRESGGVQQKLEQAQAESPPREIAAGMEKSADDLESRRQSAARAGAAKARQGLQDLSKSLGAARADYAQPQLKELMALEEQVAQLQQQLKRAAEAGDEASLQQKWQQLQSRLDRLASADPRLAKALGDSQKASSDKSSQAGTQPPSPNSKVSPTEFRNSNAQTPEGFYSWSELPESGVMREVAKALQAKIQEAILAGALQDADQPVPPAYKELVEKYYRALSDDLR